MRIAFHLAWKDILRHKVLRKGRILFIIVDEAAVTRTELLEVFGLFYRYDLDMKQLSTLNRPEFADLFRSGDSSWGDQVFGPGNVPDL